MNAIAMSWETMTKTVIWWNISMADVLDSGRVAGDHLTL